MEDYKVKVGETSKLYCIGCWKHHHNNIIFSSVSGPVLSVTLFTGSSSGARSPRTFIGDHGSTALMWQFGGNG